MTEPRLGVLRPTAMKRTATLALATAALLAAGCGQKPGTPPQANRSPDQVGSCTTSSKGVHEALPVTGAVDLDHDAVGNPLLLTRPDSECPNLLFSKVADAYVYLELKEVQLDLKSAKRVIVPGRAGDLFTINEVHPRGGFQVHLYAYSKGSLAEVTTSTGDLVLPFIATDTKGGYVSASCVDKGFVVREAVAHQPPGVVFAWDIEETSYLLDGAIAKASGTREVKDNVLDQDIARDYPELVERKLFGSGCTA